MTAIPTTIPNAALATAVGNLLCRCDHCILAATIRLRPAT